MLNPFLKWVGGKGWAAESLSNLVLQHLKPGGIYYEPFLGAGAVALALPTHLTKVLGDFCLPLTGLWTWVKLRPIAVRSAIGLAWKNDDEGYYRVRDSFNRGGHYSATDPTPSARFLWLNHACFNGLYRENKHGKFNVPHGKRKTLAIPSEPELVRIANAIDSSVIRINADFEDTLTGAKTGDVIYCDPPYDDVFDDYVAGGFGVDLQTRLAKVLAEKRDRGIFVMMTNSDTPRIRALYSDWTITEVEEPRSVAAKASSRTKAKCLLITSGPGSR